MKPKIGLALLCSDWFLDVGIGGSEPGDTNRPGAWLNFTAGPGRVLLVNMFADKENYRIFTCKGTALRDNKHKKDFMTGTGAFHRFA